MREQEDFYRKKFPVETSVLLGLVADCQRISSRAEGTGRTLAYYGILYRQMKGLELPVGENIASDEDIHEMLDNLTIEGIAFRQMNAKPDECVIEALERAPGYSAADLERVKRDPALYQQFLERGWAYWETWIHEQEAKRARERESERKKLEQDKKELEEQKRELEQRAKELEEQKERLKISEGKITEEEAKKHFATLSKTPALPGQVTEPHTALADRLCELYAENDQKGYGGTFAQFGGYELVKTRVDASLRELVGGESSAINLLDKETMLAITSLGMAREEDQLVWVMTEKQILAMIKKKPLSSSSKEDLAEIRESVRKLTLASIDIYKDGALKVTAPLLNVQAMIDYKGSKDGKTPPYRAYIFQRPILLELAEGQSGGIIRCKMDVFGSLKQAPVSLQRALLLNRLWRECEYRNILQREQKKIRRRKGVIPPSYIDTINLDRLFCDCGITLCDRNQKHDTIKFCKNVLDSFVIAEFICGYELVRGERGAFVAIRIIGN